MHRRCNYNMDVVTQAHGLIALELDIRAGFKTITEPSVSQKVSYYVEQWERSGMADVIILPYLNVLTISSVPSKLLEKLHIITGNMLAYKPFPLVTIHDSFAAHGNNCNAVRYWYKEILAELAESNILDDLLSQVYKQPGHFKKLSNNLADLIRGSEYGLS